MMLSIDENMRWGVVNQQMISIPLTRSGRNQVHFGLLQLAQLLARSLQLFACGAVAEAFVSE